PECGFQHVTRNGFKIVGPVGRGGTIHLSAYAFHYFNMLLVGNMLGTLEHHMLEEVSKSGNSDMFPVGTYFVGYFHVYDWIGMIFMDVHDQTIRQLIFLI